MKKTKDFQYDWGRVRYDWENGASFSDIARNPGAPSRTAIARRQKREGWTRKIEETIANKASRYLVGLDSVMDPLEAAELIAEEAKRRAEVERVHRQDWGPLRELLRALVELTAEVTKAKEPDQDDPAALKLDEYRRRRAEHLSKIAKQLAEILDRMQAGERKAWRLDAIVSEEESPYSNLTDQELDAKLKAGNRRLKDD